MINHKNDMFINLGWRDIVPECYFVGSNLFTKYYYQ